MSCDPHCTIELFLSDYAVLSELCIHIRLLGGQIGEQRNTLRNVKEENRATLGSNLCSTFGKGGINFVIGLHSFIDGSSVFDRQDFEG